MILAQQLVMPIRVPLCFGAKSKWLIWKPKYVDALIPTARVTKVTANLAWLADVMKARQIKAVIGPHMPMVLNSFLENPTLRIFLLFSQSAKGLKIKLMIIMAK